MSPAPARRLAALLMIAPAGLGCNALLDIHELPVEDDGGAVVVAADDASDALDRGPAISNPEAGAGQPDADQADACVANNVCSDPMGGICTAGVCGCPTGTFLSAGACHVAAIQVTVGDATACALLRDGTVRCWGSNDHGQLGSGAMTATLPVSPIPVTVAGLSGVKALGAGFFHVCAVLDNGSVRCWGANDQNELGDGSGTGSSVPVTVPGVAGTIAISAGDFHTCALVNGGFIRCWGLNGFGQLGNGVTAPALAPVTVLGLAGTPIAIACGHQLTCALIAGGSVQCWGNAGKGVLGSASPASSSAPVSIVGIAGATALTAGGGQVCAVVAGGAVRCWGNDAHGELGDGSMMNSAAPVAVVGLSGVTSIAAGATHTCAILSGGTVRCWGDNTDQQLGAESAADGSALPVTAVGLGGVTSLASGGHGSCVVVPDGSARCWGSNLYGSLGTGTATPSSTPVMVVGW